MPSLFLPTTRGELKILGWDSLDVVLVTGDAHIDSPFVGVALIGRVLEAAGFRVGIIGQPDLDSDADIVRLGEPRLFWGVSGGCVDSMVANWTALNKRRRSDDFTPGGKNERRPDRAVIAYSNLIRRYFKRTAPVVLGGLEASLRRISHYDCPSDSIRRSILVDAKADLLVYGMGERAVIEVAERLRQGRDLTGIPGTCHMVRERPPEGTELPAHDAVKNEPSAFIDMFRTFYDNQDPVSGQDLCQRQDSRYLVHHRPAEPLSQQELDRIHELSFTRAVHPHDLKAGAVRAQDTIRFSLPALRGCYGECNFCGIAAHAGRIVQWRSRDSLVREARALTALPDFKGTILDVGGPTANMWGFECERKLKKGACRNRRCLTPQVCDRLPVDHGGQLALLRELSNVPGVKRVFVASGIRHDLVLADKKHGRAYIDQLAREHVSGQLKLAPEHSHPHVLARMGKPDIDSLLEFRRRFLKASQKAGKKQFLTYYFIAAHPGCEQRHMDELARFVSRELKIQPEQVQVFTPLPGTWSAVMYWTGRDPFTGERVFVERDLRAKARQKESLVRNQVERRKRSPNKVSQDKRESR